jgi:hypothetical protein
VLTPKKGTEEQEFEMGQFEAGMGAEEEFWKEHTQLNAGGMVLFAAAILHDMATLRRTPHWSRLFGFACGTLFRMSAIASLGEARHWNKLKRAQGIAERETVYKEWLECSLAQIEEKLTGIMPCFMDREAWGQSPGYGGPKWYAFALEAITLFNRMSDRDWKGALEQLNTVVNAVHNNGWALNKFTQKAQFDVVSTMPIVGILPSDQATRRTTMHALYLALTHEGTSSIVGPRVRQIDSLSVAGIEAFHIVDRAHQKIDPERAVVKLCVKESLRPQGLELKYPIWWYPFIYPPVEGKEMFPANVSGTYNTLGESHAWFVDNTCISRKDLLDRANWDEDIDLAYNLWGLVEKTMEEF